MIEEPKERLSCDECGCKCIVQNSQLVCCTCGLIQEQIPSCYFSTAPPRSKERGNEGYIQSHHPSTTLGTNFNSSESRDFYKFRRIKEIQKKTNIFGNETKENRKKDKQKDSLPIIEKTYRIIGLPINIKGKIFNLFWKSQEEIKFPANKSHLYLSAVGWWYTDIHQMTDITVHSICRRLYESEMVENDTEIEDGIARLIRSKLKNIRRNKNRLNEDQIKMVISKLMETICKKADSVLNQQKEIEDRVKELKERAETHRKKIHEEREKSKENLKEIINALSKETFIKAEIKDVESKIGEISEIKLDKMLKEVVFQIKEEEPRLINVTGMEEIYKIYEEGLSKNEILDLLGISIDKIVEKYSKKRDRLKSRLGKYRSQIEDVLNSEDKDKFDNPTIEGHIKKNIRLLNRRNLLTNAQAEMLENTTMEIFYNVPRSQIVGRSRHGVAVTMIWLSLMYHGVKMSISDMAEMLTVSESTLTGVGNLIAEISGFSKSENAGKYGYLRPIGKDTILQRLGEPKMFEETYDSVIEKVKKELILILGSSTIPEYTAGRLLTIKLLLEGRKLHKNECKKIINTKYLNNCVNSRKRHIKDNAVMIYSDIMLPISYLKKGEIGNGGGMSIIKTTEAEIDPKNKKNPYKDFVLYIPRNIREYLEECFSPFGVFVDQCLMGRWDEQRCKTALKFLLTRLKLTVENWKEITLPYYFN